MLKRVVKRANGLQSSDEECENLRDFVYFSTIVDIFPHVETYFFGAGQGKVCVGRTQLQLLRNDRYPTSTRRRSNGSRNTTTTGNAITVMRSITRLAYMVIAQFVSCGPSQLSRQRTMTMAKRAQRRERMLWKPGMVEAEML